MKSTKLTSSSLSGSRVGHIKPREPGNSWSVCGSAGGEAQEERKEGKRGKEEGEENPPGRKEAHGPLSKVCIDAQDPCSV